MASSSSTLPNPSARGVRRGYLLLVSLLVLFAAAKGVLFDTLDPDCFWHMRVARQLQQDGIAPLADKISFASIRARWTPYSWLAELGMKQLWDMAGYQGAVAAQALMMAGIVMLLGLSCRTGAESIPPHLAATPWAHETPPRSRLSAAVATTFAAYCTLPCLSFRPVTAALLLMALCIWLLLRDRRLGERTRAVWLIPPITALMTNLHLYAVLMPGWIGLLFIGALLERRRCDAEDRPIATRHARRYGLLAAMAAAAACMTPMLGGAIRTAFHYGLHDPMVSSRVIREMQPFTDGVGGKFSAAIVGLAAFWAIRNRGRIRIGERLWLIAGLILLFRLARFAPLYAMVAGPVLAVTMPTLSDRVLGKRVLIATMIGVLTAGTLRVLLSFPAGHTTLGAWVNRMRPDAEGYPDQAAEFVANHLRPMTGNIINEFNWGGYLAWRLGDHYRVLLDGRTQLYSAQFWEMTYLGDESQRRQFLAGVRADAAILPLQKSLFRQSLRDLGWKSVYRDDQAEVLTPPAPVADVSE